MESCSPQSTAASVEVMSQHTHHRLTLIRSTWGEGVLEHHAFKTGGSSACTLKAAISILTLGASSQDQGTLSTLSNFMQIYTNQYSSLDHEMNLLLSWTTIIADYMSY